MRDLRHRFQVLREIPGPRTAAVFHALDRISGREVAVKTLPVDHDQAQDLRDEASRHASLRHPRLATFTTRFEGVLGFDDRTVTGFATEWSPGEPLDAWVRARTVQHGLDAMATVVGVVQWLHRRRWLHLDLKPDNVLGASNGPVLLDLGTARPISSGTRSAGGTLGFAAPEVVRGEAPAEQSDLFSIGVLMFSAFGGELDDTLMRGLATQDVALPSLRLWRSDLPDGVVELVDRLRSPRPHDRPESCEPVLEALYAAGAARPERSLVELGEPALVERSALVDSVVERLDGERACAIAVLGGAGAGRSRLAREVLWRIDVSDGRIVQDLSAEPIACLQRLLHAAGAPGSGRLDDPRVPAWLAEKSRFVATFFLGRLEEHSAADADRVREIIPMLTAGGVSVLVATPGLEVGLSPVGLAPLPVSALRAIATDLGHSAYQDFDVVCGIAEGRPGALIDALINPRPTLASLDTHTRQMAEQLRWLPAPIPFAVAPVLPDALQRAMSTLAECGLMKARGRSWWHDLDLPIDQPPTDAARDLASRVLEGVDDLGVAWRARLCARAGLVDEPGRWLDGLRRAQQEAPTAVEVAERLGLQGHRWAALLAARKLSVAGQAERVTRLLDGVPESQPDAAQSRMALIVAPATRSARLAGVAYLEDWLATYGENAAIRARIYYLFCALGEADPLEAKIVEDAASKAVSEEWKDTRFGLSVQLFLLCARCKAGLPEQPALQRLMARITDGYDDLIQLDPLLLFFLREGARALNDREQAMKFAHVAVAQADEVGDLNRAAFARFGLGLELHDFCQAEPARRAHREALSLFEQLGDVGWQLRSVASLADLEVHSGRLASAEVLLRRFDEIKASLPYHAEAEVRGKVLWAAFHSVHLRPEMVVNLLEGLEDLDKVPSIVVFYHGLYLAEAYVDLGAHAQARDLLESLPSSPFPTDNIRLRTAKGRAYIGVGRALLQQAVPPLDIEPDPLDQESIGLSLMAAGGEDLDPNSFALRRRQLERATELLEGERRVRAAALKDRLLEGPGAALDQIVRLVEAVGQGDKLLEVVAQIVSDALGAHRVLVMLRLPGLGRQLTAREISGQESAGLAPEIWRRVRRPDDVWLAEDAFADPNLRRLSATVRTFQVKSVVAVAIPKGGKAIGALYVDDIHRAGRFGPADVDVLKRIARAIGDVADALPTGPPSDGLAVHDLHGMYTCDSELARRSEAVFDRVASMQQSNLLLSGPTGAGKTWMAKRIAADVFGANGLVEVVLRPGPTEMLVSQLWGTRVGDFTGAVARKGAIFEAWSRGAVLFLDELQNLDEVGQRVLLPLLELPHRRFGSLTSGVADLERPLHIILGTNAQLDNNGWSGTFREDLWWRISPVRIDLPPLSKRGREAVYRHLEDLLRQLGLPAPEDVFERGALQQLATHTWPGNLRSLADLAERAAIQFRSQMQRIPASALESLGLQRGSPDRIQTAPTPSSAPLASAQSRTVLEVLGRHDYVQATAAEELGISKYALHRLLKRLDLIEHVRDRRNAMRK